MIPFYEYQRMLVRALKEGVSGYAGTYSSPIPSPVLEDALRVSGPALRDIVRTARRAGILIGQGRERGYFLATTTAEIDDTMRDLAGRAESLQLTLTAMREAYRKLAKQERDAQQHSLFVEN